jgi:hypothetical protein
MAFYIVHKANPYFKNGTIIELFEHGFQEVVMEQVGNRLQAVDNVGLVHLERLVKPFCIKMLKNGFDKPGLRTRKTEYA